MATRGWTVGLLALCALGPLRSFAAAEVVELEPAADNTMWPDAFSGNGAGQHMFTGVTMLGGRRRALIRFDLSSVPVGSTVNTAILTLYCSRGAPGSGPRAVGLHRVLAPWGEGTSDGIGAEGGGPPATPGDVTWFHSVYPDVFWNQLGGDFDPQPSAGTIVAYEGYFAWNSADLTADIQSFIDDPSQNFGWILIGDEDDAGTAKKFDTRENPNPLVRPCLTVDYTPGPAVRRCIGDGSASSACPCGNASLAGAGQGCGNSLAPYDGSDPASATTGALIDLASGSTASLASPVGAGGLQLVATRIPPVSSGIFLVSVGGALPGLPSSWDGILCAGGGPRLNPGLETTPGARVSGDDGALGPSLVSDAEAQVPGYFAPGTYGFSYWYRDNHPGHGQSPCGTGANFTSGLEVLLTP